MPTKANSFSVLANFPSWKSDLVPFIEQQVQDLRILTWLKGFSINLQFSLLEKALDRFLISRFGSVIIFNYFSKLDSSSETLTSSRFSAGSFLLRSTFKPFWGYDVEIIPISDSKVPIWPRVRPVSTEFYRKPEAHSTAICYINLWLASADTLSFLLLRSSRLVRWLIGLSRGISF